MSGARLHFSEFVGELRGLFESLRPASPLYIVGGAVRDAWLGKPTDDIDVAMAGDSIRMARRAADALGGDIFVMDRERGIARVFVKRGDATLTLDFSRLRGDSLEADLRMRDFTINAMAVDVLGDASRLIDPVGGEADLRDRVLRQCSDASFADDPIRTLRAVRQSVQFGCRIEPATLAQLRLSAHRLRLTSSERIRDEFFKLLSLDGAARGIRVLGRLGMLSQILPGGDDGAGPESLKTVERLHAILGVIGAERSDNSAAAFDLGMLAIQFDRYRAGLQRHLAQEYGLGRRQAQLVLLAALLLEHSPKEAREASMSLRLSREEEGRLVSALRRWQSAARRTPWTDLARHRYWHKQGAVGIDALLLWLAHVLGERGAELRQAEWLAIVEHATVLLDAWFNRRDEIVAPPQLLRGDDIMALLDLREGRAIGRLLDALREAQVTKRVKSVAEAREFVKGEFAKLS